MCRPNPHLNFLRNSAPAASVEDLRARLVEIANRTEAIIGAADAAGRKLTPEDNEEITALSTEFDSVSAELATRDKAESIRAKASEPVGRQALPPDLIAGPSRPGPVADPRAARAGIILPANCANPSALLLPRSNDPWRGNSDQFFNSLANGLADPRLMLAETGTTGSGADGGFAVPPSFFIGIIDQALAQAELAPRCRMFMTATNQISIPMPDVQNRQGDIAGLSANWSGENEQQTANKMRWRNVDVRLHKIFILAEASAELAEDGLNFQAQLQQKMAESAAYALDRAIVAGIGVKQPLGIINDPSAIAVAPESGQAADTVLFLNLVAMFGRLAPASQKKAVWFISPSVLTQLLTMQFPSSGGTNIPVLLGNGAASNAGAYEFVGSILGRPVIVTEVCNPVGDAGDVILADLSQFALAMRASARIEIDRSNGFDRDAIQWRLIWRVSGSGMWNAPVTPYSGGSTLGWCAYLQART